MLTVALPKGRLGESVYKILENAGYACPEMNESSRKLVFENKETGVRYLQVKPSDVAVYVERGAADVGIAGKDILEENSPRVYELLDLGFGKCRMAVAAKNGFVDNPARTLRVATKFVNIASRHYANKGRNIDIIPLHGSIELAPITNMSDVIVDIVESGSTLKENDLCVIEEFMQISARFIVNEASFKFKEAEINRMLEKLKEATQK
ncbi:MAG: ATP phosphoribosyltransferase [Ruminococcaceae bacterium]|nr:ATP phosphoribosyltransferase [Oscillospiraceae bacterium]